MQYHKFLLVVAAASLLSGCSSTSKWTGTWVPEGHPERGGDLHCVARNIEEGKWNAKFSGYCGRQFVYRIDMLGNEEGDNVMFSGEVDLGEKDGGAYQWTGEMSDDEFTGKYTSLSGKKGTFAMKRK